MNSLTLVCSWLRSPLRSRRRLYQLIVGSKLSMCLWGFIPAAFQVKVPPNEVWLHRSRPCYTRDHNWRFYYENFRFLRQTPTTSLPWGYHSLGALAPLPEPSHCKKGANLCKHWKAYIYLSCTLGCLFYLPQGCSFKHDCFKCEGSRRALKCNKTKVQANTLPIKPLPIPAQQLAAPVNIKRMLPFLSGYNHSIAQLLESGFTSGSWTSLFSRGP